MKTLHRSEIDLISGGTLITDGFRNALNNVANIGAGIAVLLNAVSRFSGKNKVMTDAAMVFNIPTVLVAALTAYDLYPSSQNVEQHAISDVAPTCVKNATTTC